MQPDALREMLELDHIINAIGYSTPLGNAVQDAEVIEAMSAAARTYIRMDQLEQRASELIANLTGAEAGYVVNGAAGGLVLAAAACLAGLDPVRMNALPEVLDGGPSSIVIHRAHRYDYDHTLRQAGAQLIEVGFPDLTFAYDLDAAIDARTAAVMFRADGSDNVVPLQDVVAIAHAKRVPVIVDAALAIPPVTNLSAFVAAGADLVVFSGGKAIEGPPASGFVAGRSDLIMSMALQHQDMDVRSETWTSRHLVEEGVIPGPPYQGIGRALKVGKEQIVGLCVALQKYVNRDHAADLARWRATIDRIRGALDGRVGSATVLSMDGGAPLQAVPEIRIALADPREAAAAVRALQARRPAVFVNERALWRGELVITPTNLLDGDESRLIDALIEVLGVDGRSECPGE